MLILGLYSMLIAHGANTCSIECSCYSILIPRPCGLGMRIRLYRIHHSDNGTLNREIDPYCPIVVKSRCLLNQFLTLEVSTVLVPE